jgi:hypothetical protein
VSYTRHNSGRTDCVPRRLLNFLSFHRDGMGKGAWRPEAQRICSHEVGVLPSPLVGRAGEGGRCCCARRVRQLLPPPPTPPQTQVGLARLAQDNVRPGQARGAWGRGADRVCGSRALNLDLARSRPRAPDVSARAVKGGGDGETRRVDGNIAANWAGNVAAAGPDHYFLRCSFRDYPRCHCCHGSR